MKWTEIITESSEEQIEEGRVQNAVIDDPRRSFSLPVVEDPNAAQLRTLLTRWNDKGRFILDTDGHLWVWAMGRAIHFDVMSALGIPDEKIGGYIEPGKIGVRSDYDGRLSDVGYELRQSDAIVRAMGGPSFQIYRSEETSSY